MKLMETYDLAIVGAGILGLAHALAATRFGKRVIVIDRDAQANGASIRNFGFITVTGQERGESWRRAKRTRDVWAEVAPKAGIDVEHAGLVVGMRRAEAVAVAESFLKTEMGEGCALLSPNEALRRSPMLNADALQAGLWSPHELRVESRTAIAKLAAWLEAEFGVTFLRSTQVLDVAPPRIRTSRGVIHADAVVVCPGDDFLTLYPERIAAYGVTKCKLHMLRVMPNRPQKLGAAIMSDLGLARYAGYAALPEAQALKTVLAHEQADALENGVHLIAVQSADGSLVVGDSHHYSATPDPWQPEHVDKIILNEMDKAMSFGSYDVIERWTGVYASAARTMFRDRPSEAVRVVMVTGGTGASTGFAIGEETIDELYGE